MMIRVFFFTIIFFFSFFSVHATSLDHVFVDEEFVFSNFPESISSPGLVFDKPINKTALRVLYHHKNISSELLNIVFLLSNISNESVIVNIQKGLGGSSSDVVFAGHKATREFFESVMLDSDYVTLAPGASESVIIHKIKPDQTSSGIVRFQPFLDDTIEVKMMVVDMHYSNISGFRDVPDLLAQYRVSVFDESYRKINETFNLDQQMMSFELGGAPYLKDKFSNFFLKGNYGLVYGIEVTLKNPYSDFVNVEFFLSPNKKESVDRGVFIVDGNLIEVGVLHFKDSTITMEMFHEVLMSPNETRTIFMYTLPQAGCFYPVDIVMKSRAVS